MRSFAQKQNQPQKPVSSSLARPKTETPGPDHREHPILHLQRAIGNQAVQRMLQRDAVELKAGLIGTASPRFGHAFSRIPIHPPAASAIQTKLAINKPGDEYEQEADRISQQVMRMPEPQLQRACACGGGCPTCQMEQTGQEQERLQPKRLQPGNLGQTAVPPMVHEVLRSPGQPLDPEVRAFMEPRFGHDFNQVRVHTDARATGSARVVDALSYAVGHNMVFGMGRFAPGTHEGRRLIAHELTHVVQQSGAEGFRVGQSNVKPDLALIARAPKSVQRKCDTELGSPAPACTPSDKGVAGLQFMFRVKCDDLLPGEEAKINKLKPGSELNIHGFASRDGAPDFNDNLSCHRANRIAELARAQRADCPVVGIFKHGASPVAAPGVAPDVNPPDFWRSVIIEEVKPTPESGEMWLDPSRIINQGWALHARAKQNPTQANLDVVAARRTQIKTWLEDIPKSLAPTGAQLNRQHLSDYRRFYASGEQLWIAIDQLLAIHKHAATATDAHDAWAAGSGKDQGLDKYHAQDVPAGARYHIDLFGEGYFPGAINIGMATRTTTTGLYNTRVPNLIYRQFSDRDLTVNKLPIADQTADLVTSENGPIGYPGLAEEIARIIAPGGTIVLYGPKSEEMNHDRVAKLTGGTVTKVKRDALETKIVVPGP